LEVMERVSLSKRFINPVRLKNNVLQREWQNINSQLNMHIEGRGLWIIGIVAFLRLLWVSVL
jgi:hypothetical protein